MSSTEAKAVRMRKDWVGVNGIGRVFEGATWVEVDSYHVAPREDFSDSSEEPFTILALNLLCSYFFLLWD